MRYAMARKRRSGKFNWHISSLFEKDTPGDTLNGHNPGTPFLN